MPGMDRATKQLSHETMDARIAIPGASMHADAAQKKKADPLRFLLVTAYDVNYKVGFLCSVVNEAYCKKHGYGFARVVRSQEEMCKLSSGRHLAWGKVAILRDLLQRSGTTVSPCIEVRAHDFDYVVWIDADAMILNHNLKLEQFVTFSQEADFIIGEDMADTDFLNTGLMFFRTCSGWCKDLLQKWWNDSETRWHQEVCWDQTGLCCLLQAQGLLDQKKHWFSWCGGPQHKRMRNMFVFDCGSFNFKYLNSCKFVFHAVGERELAFSFSRQLLRKEDRLYAAVRDGFVEDGRDVEVLEDSSSVSPMRPGDVDSATLQLQHALQFWRAYGISRSGMRGQPPPLGWGCQMPALCLNAANLVASSEGSAVLQLREVLSARRLPVWIVACSDVPQDCFSHSHILHALGEVPVRLQRPAPGGKHGLLTCKARFWQLWDYATGCPPPFSPLSATSNSPWCLRGWNQWQLAPQAPSLLEIAASFPSWMHQACAGG
ncbi:hypothetical protein AK812_SmicGene41744 [Symbiodinium microadriaticum]|uniref:Nucleotide-diphospho-sugar transferase domain-containing protein n=1 Tax=Symbiodinium microadriaticum TaxID=2951 RepID=A0A1Q9C5B5_SYMMI|nr:hypothetical protein AK812_SmicGene41744 [Symbiodinium microadriaticum]